MRIKKTKQFYCGRVDKKKTSDTSGIENAIRAKDLSGIAPFIEFKTKYYSCDGSTNDKRGYFNKRQVLNWFKEAFKSSGKYPIKIERRVHAEGMYLDLSIYSGMGGYEISLVILLWYD